MRLLNETVKAFSIHNHSLNTPNTQPTTHTTMATADIDITARPLSHDPSAPDPIAPHAGSGAAPSGDPLDDLLDTDRAIDNVYRDTGANDTTAPANGHTIDLNDGNGDDDAPAEGGLGIDEEVKVRKPRAPMAKLDETRLLSERGIPRLRGWKVGKDRCRFKGKGHEVRLSHHLRSSKMHNANATRCRLQFSDMSRLLSTYQLWLDDLFPKAKFGDGLSMIEKLGHSRRMQLMRREWINEDKPKPADIDPSDDEAMADAAVPHEDDGLFVRDERSRAAEERPSTPVQQDVNADYEERYAMPSPGVVPRPAQRTGQAQGSATEASDPASAQGRGPNAEVEWPEEDELDQLLAEDARGASADGAGVQTAGAGNDGFADDEDAMREMGGDW